MGNSGQHPKPAVVITPDDFGQPMVTGPFVDTRTASVWIREEMAQHLKLPLQFTARGPGEFDLYGVYPHGAVFRGYIRPLLSADTKHAGTLKVVT